MKQVQLAADAAVVALLRLLEAMQVLIELLLVRPGGTVDPLEHLVARVPAPIRPRHLRQLEGLELPGRGHVRPAAQVDPVPLAVEADLILLGNTRDDLGLVHLAQALEELDSLIARHHPARDFLVCLRQLLHLRLDGGEVFHGEGTLIGEVVVEAILDHRPDRHLRIRKELLHRLREQMRGGVANDLEPIRIPFGHDRDSRVATDDMRGVDELAIDTACERGLAQARANARRDLIHGDGMIEAALAAIRQGHDGHEEALYMIGTTVASKEKSAMKKGCSRGRPDPEAPSSFIW